MYFEKTRGKNPPDVSTVQGETDLLCELASTLRN